MVLKHSRRLRDSSSATSTAIAQNLDLKRLYGHAMSRIGIEECLSGSPHFDFLLLLLGIGYRWQNPWEPGTCAMSLSYCETMWKEMKGTAAQLPDESKIHARQHQQLTDRIRSGSGLNNDRAGHSAEDTVENSGTLKRAQLMKMLE